MVKFSYGSFLSKPLEKLNKVQDKVEDKVEKFQDKVEAKVEKIQDKVEAKVDHVQDKVEDVQETVELLQDAHEKVEQIQDLHEQFSDYKSKWQAMIMCQNASTWLLLGGTLVVCIVGFWIGFLLKK